MFSRVLLSIVLAISLCASISPMIAMGDDYVPLPSGYGLTWDHVTAWSKKSVDWTKEKVSDGKDWAKNIYEAIGQDVPTQPSSASAPTMQSVPVTPITPASDTVSRKRDVIESREVPKRFAVTCDKDLLIKCGVGVVAVVIIGHTAYELYKNGKIRKANLQVQEFVRNHRVGITILSLTAGVALAAVYAKYCGVTYEQVHSGAMNFLAKAKSKTTLLVPASPKAA